MTEDGVTVEIGDEVVVGTSDSELTVDAVEAAGSAEVEVRLSVLDAKVEPVAAGVASSVLDAKDELVAVEVASSVLDVKSELVVVGMASCVLV